MPNAGALYESSRPCPQCGRDVDLSNTKPGGQTFCGNREAHRDNRRVVIRRTLRPPAWKAEVAAAEAAAIAADPVTRWDAEMPGAVDWRATLGPVCAEADRCDDHCRCSSPPIRWTADHTATVCPECDPGCWDPSPGSVGRGRAHVAASAVIARTGSTPAAQADLDRKAREFERRRARVLDSIDRQLATPRLTLDSRTDLTWFRREVEQAAGPGRLAQLHAQLSEATWEVEPVPLRERIGGWFRSTEPGDDDDYDQDDDADDYDEPEPERGQLAPVTYPGSAWRQSWRQTATPAELAYWDQIGAPQLAPDYPQRHAAEVAAARARQGAPVYCTPCLVTGIRRPAVQTAKVPGWRGAGTSVCAEHAAATAQARPGPVLRLVAGMRGQL